MSAEQKYRPSPLPDRPPIPVPNLDGVDMDNLTAWQRRVVLASMGWTSQCRLTARNFTDDCVLNVWVKHANWQGSFSEVILFASENLGVKPWLDVPRVEGIADDLSAKVFNRALKAMRDFPDTVPCQMPDGSLVVHSSETARLLKFPHTTFNDRYVLNPERALPTESLPGWPGFGSMSDFLIADSKHPHSIIQEILELAAWGISWDDHLDTFGRFYGARGHVERRWTFGSDTMVSSWGGIKLDVRKSRALKHDTSDLSSFGPAQLARGVLQTVQYWADAYGPGCGLPPGAFRLEPEPLVIKPDAAFAP